MADVKIVYGPPCSGKSTYVEKNIGDQDIRFDYDLIMQSISNRNSHEYSDDHLPYVIGCRSLLIDKSRSDKNIDNVFIIATKLTDKLMEETRDIEAEYILVDTTKEQCFEYLESDGTRKDKEFWKEKINNWFEWYEELNMDPKAVITVENRQSYLKTNFKTRELENGKKFIEGYFIRYNEETELWPGVYEEVGQGSLAKSLKDNDIRALFNHNSEIVLGRTGNNTVKLEDKKEGLWGSIEINPNDKQASDIHARIERGDINGSSFGFNIINEETINRDDGSVKFILKEIDLHEVSPCTFPAYPTTAIQARKKDYSNYKQRQLDAKKLKLKERLKNVKTIND